MRGDRLESRHAGGRGQQHGGTACQNQSVASVANASLAIGRAAPAADEIGVSLTQVIVQIESTVMGGGAQAAVAGSSSGAV